VITLNTYKGVYYYIPAMVAHFLVCYFKQSIPLEVTDKWGWNTGD